MTRAPDLVRSRSQAEVLVAGVKVATQTPPIRSGKRVVFVTLDDARGPVDATFFEDAQGPYAATLFHSWLLVIRGARPAHRSARGVAAGHRLLGAAGAARRLAGGGLDAVAAADGREPGRSPTARSPGRPRAARPGR